MNSIPTGTNDRSCNMASRVETTVELFTQGFAPQQACVPSREPCEAFEGARVGNHLEESSPYRDLMGELCERTVAISLVVPLDGLRSRTRQTADVALARQIAMYLLHTVFRRCYTDVGLHFGRDRTTVSHACALVEDKRDDQGFDLMISELEDLLMIVVEFGTGDSCAEITQ